jgi:general secretion pathway protein D
MTLPLLANAAFGLDSGHSITPNFKDADLTQVAEAVSAATGKNFIIDPRVRGQVTMLASTPMDSAALYEAFLAILQVHGFIAVAAGNLIKILPDANARQIPSVDLPDHVSSTSDEIVTQVVDVKNVSAAQLVPILRPMMPQYGQLSAYPAANILILSDRASNVARMIRIIQRVDRVADQDVEVVTLSNASAADCARVVNALFQQASQEGGPAIKLVADERSNSVLISGDQTQRLRIRALIAHLDMPPGNRWRHTGALPPLRRRGKSGPEAQGICNGSGILHRWRGDAASASRQGRNGFD